jgi:hypothetical protein
MKRFCIDNKIYSCNIELSGICSEHFSIVLAKKSAQGLLAKSLASLDHEGHEWQTSPPMAITSPHIHHHQWQASPRQPSQMVTMTYRWPP